MTAAGLIAALVLNQVVELTVSIAPGAIEEPCFPLARNDRLEFDFSAAAPLDFNLHYHEDGVFFPVDFRDVTGREGQYVAPAARSYCLMWTNKQSAPVELDYRYRIYSEDASP
jgi:hypothetical protein